MQYTLPCFRSIRYDKWRGATDKELWEVVNEEISIISDTLWHYSVDKARGAEKEAASLWGEDTKKAWDKKQWKQFNEEVEAARKGEFDLRISLSWDRLLFIRLSLRRLGMPKLGGLGDAPVNRNAKRIINTRKVESKKFNEEMRATIQFGDLNEAGVLKPTILQTRQERAEIEAENKKKQEEYIKKQKQEA